MAPKMVEGGQIWLKCITGDLIMVIRDKNNIFERVENFHADLAWNYPPVLMFADVFDGKISDQYLSCCLMKQVGDFTYSLLGEDTLYGSLAARIAASM